MRRQSEGLILPSNKCYHCVVSLHTEVIILTAMKLMPMKHANVSVGETRTAPGKAQTAVQCFVYSRIFISDEI